MYHILISFWLVTIISIAPSHAVAARTTNTELQNEIKIILQENPQLVLDAFKGHEDELYDLVQIGLEKKNKAKIRNRQIAQLANPSIPAEIPNRPIWGNTKGDISIFAYADFQSASCSKANKTIQQLLQDDLNVRYQFRHNPQGFHKMSRPAALYFEAISLQSHQKAKEFNRLNFINRAKIKKYGLKELDSIATQAGADLARLHKDIKSPVVINSVDRDIKEAKKFGFTASPVFVVNGITITGAAAIEEFMEVIKIIREYQSK